MEVILNQDVEKLGRAGTIIKVKDGFARNFLIPNGMAVPVTAATLKKLEQERSKKAQQQEKLKRASESLKDKLANFSLTIPALIHEEDKLYGSIAAAEIAQALKDEGFDIDKSCIALDEPIKALGIYEVPVKLHPEVTTKIKIWIVKK